MEFLIILVVEYEIWVEGRNKREKKVIFPERPLEYNTKINFKKTKR